MQYGGIIAMAASLPRRRLGQDGAPWLARFTRKVVLDVLPGALASLIGGFLFTQYHFAAAPPAAPAAATPASAEMLQMVRDEHAQIMDYLQKQTAAQQKQDALARAEDQRAVADARLADARMAQAAAARRLAAAAVEPKPPTPHGEPVVAAVAPTPVPTVFVVAQADPANLPPALVGVAAPPVVAPAPRSIVARTVATTLDIEDHVVHATLHAVSAIGSIPSWIASMGDHSGDNSAKPIERQFSAAS